jgi:hypothetical protein
MLFFLRNEEETQPEGPAPITRTSTNSLPICLIKLLSLRKINDKY